MLPASPASPFDRAPLSVKAFLYIGLSWAIARPFLPSLASASIAQSAGTGGPLLSAAASVVAFGVLLAMAIKGSQSAAFGLIGLIALLTGLDAWGWTQGAGDGTLVQGLRLILVATGAALLVLLALPTTRRFLQTAQQAS